MDAISEARTLFRFIDTNDDGLLDLVERYDGLREFGLTDAHIQSVFFDLGVNKDGQVSEEEFCVQYAASFPYKQASTNYDEQPGAERDGEPPPIEAEVSLAEKQADAPLAKKVEKPSAKERVVTDQ